jgi:2-dehydro-3-deoxygalactonokinase
MHYIGIIDCGTTNSRFSIVGEDGSILANVSAKIGVKDTAACGSKEPLKRGLMKLFEDALAVSGLDASRLKFVMSSGMITSELGLMELPHQVAPVGKYDLARSLYRLPGSSDLGIGVDIYLVRGIKNAADPLRGSPISAAKNLDFMRGEETQMMGLLEIYGGGKAATAVNLSSHTKFISIDDKDRILGSVTTLSGQIYESLATDSIIAKSIVSGSRDAQIEDRNELARNLHEAALFAAEAVRDHGLLRSFLMPRFMDTLMMTDWRVRKRFLEACIVADDLKILKAFPQFGFRVGERMFLIGIEERCRLFEELFLLTPQGRDAEIVIISGEEAVRNLAIRGALYIARQAGLL